MISRANIFAHRGCWSQNEEKNSFNAIKTALKSGFGIEIDFRDMDGEIVVSHDLPHSGMLEAKVIFDLYTQLGSTSRMALNIKADGLQKLLIQLLAETGVPAGSYYAFDMSVPDALGYIKRDFPIYTRVSEYEDVPCFLDDASGVWIDNFSGSFDQVAAAKRILADDKRACIVSAELHQRDPNVLWADIAAAGLHENALFELCTDFPEAAYQFFVNQDGT